MATRASVGRVHVKCTFGTAGFDHRSHTQSIDLNAVRLAFQVFVPDGAGRMRRPLPAVVSDIIYDKKAMSDLLIMRSSHCSGTIRGGTQVILLCEKVLLCRPVSLPRPRIACEARSVSPAEKARENPLERGPEQ